MIKELLGMKTKTVLKTISILMFIAAVIYISYALTHPEFGEVFYIGNFAVGPELWRLFYLIYAVIMAGLFAISHIKK